MKFDVMLTGVGGEGVLTAGAIVAKAANIEGNFVRGVQLHGLAQRGGTIPTFVRFGSEEEIHSPGIMKADADLIIAFEPLEAVRAVDYARKEKTSFIINEYPYMPVYGNLQDLPYPKTSEITERVKPFAKKTMVFNTDDIAKEKFGKIIYGNTILLGAAVGSGELPITEESMKKALKETVPRGLEENMKSFDMGVEIGGGKSLDP